MTDTSSNLILISKDPKAKAILDGLSLNCLTVKNAETGEVVWRSDDWSDTVFTQVMEAHLPARTLSFPAVGREITFASRELIKDLRIEQNVIVHGNQVEQWNYRFHFVIPNSENTWETIVESAGEGHMLPAEFLSGNMYIVTSFFDGDLFISRSVVRVFYE